MCVLVYAESPKGQLKKAAQECVYYGHLVSKVVGQPCYAVVLGPAENTGDLGAFGAEKVIHIDDDRLKHCDSQQYTAVLADVAHQLQAETIVVSHSSTGKALVGRLAIAMEAGSVSGVNHVPTLDGGFRVKKTVFSGKAIAEYEVRSAIRVLSLMGNAIPPSRIGEPVGPENVDVAIPPSAISVTETKTMEGTVPLPEAELVVSAGRGMKAPENWGIIETLAKTLGAATACSRPVADSDWRPHHEHVGQTGVAIRPNLYIAIGISGAIQHLAGVNNSKVIVVINKDPEAPFFKAADYGVCADLFDVVPRLTEAIQRFKASQ